MSVGSEIMYGDTMAPDIGWEEKLNQGWNREGIVEEGTKLNLKFQVCHSLGPKPSRTASFVFLFAFF